MDCAVIDIGSNSVRLMIKAGGENKKILSTTQLGRGLIQSGVLSASAMQDTINAILEFKELSQGLPIFAFATEAVRSAKNGEEFIQAVKEETGIIVELLSPEDEARAGFLGAARKGCATVIDIGGASTEFAKGCNGSLLDSISYKIGAVKLFDNCGDDLEKSEKYLDTVFKDFSFEGEIIGIGGTATALGAMSAGLEKYKREVVHGYELTLPSIQKLLDKLLPLSVDERLKLFPVLQEKRARVICSGAIILSYVLRKYNLPSVRLSDSDNTEGYLIMRGI